MSTGLALSPGGAGALVLPARDPAELRRRHLDRLLADDTPHQDRFSRITQLARTIFGVRTSTVTLLDEGSPDQDFAGRIVDSGEPLLVQDATAVEDFADLPQVAGPPYLRFFAGVPLADDQGVVLGAFCLYDTVPRRLDGTQWATLLELAAWARRELVDSADMARARQVQESLLPRSAPVLPGYEIAAVCLPAKSVGGDFYDFSLAPGRMTLSVIDVMGKGPGAALVAATVRALLRATLSAVAVGLGGRDPDATGRAVRGGVSGIVADVDRLVSADLDRTGTLVTGFFCELLPGTGLVRYVDAGHGFAAVLRADGSAEWLRSDDLPIGVEASGRWTDHEARLLPGDTLFCVSDGLLDLVGGTGEALAAIAAVSSGHRGAGDLIRRIRTLTESGIAIDDVTAVAVRREEAGR